MTIPEGRVHIVGAGGSGMSAIARLLVGQGHQLSGSDLRGGASLDSLTDLGVDTYVGHHPEVAEKASLVIASSAIPEYDEELEAARRAGIPVWRRPQVLEALTADIRTVGPTGTHGKTTTTAMLVTALRAMGEDPSFIVGGDIVDIGTNGHYGTDPLLVLEADEAFRTFEHLHLDGLIVTNVEHEHVDHFESESELVAAFVTVAEGVAGPVVACADDPGSARVAQESGAVTYGFGDEADWVLTRMTAQPGETLVGIEGPRGKARIALSQPGDHMALNAAGAVVLLSEIGYDLKESVEAIASFRGVGRRWDHKGTVSGVVLYDDYAHHPTEVAAVLEAAGDIAVGRTWAVFQPHLYSRTERFSEEFGVSLAKADVAVVTDVFGARETPVPGVTGEIVAEAVQDAGGNVHYVPHRFDLAAFLAPKLQAGDLVLSLGAGDITLLHSELAPLLASRS